MRYRNWFKVIWGGLIGMMFGLAVLVSAAAQSEPPDMPPMPRGLEPPPTVYPPTQVSLGAQHYYQICMACHGDRGQGLTDEWRGALDLEDQNCWQSRCHAANHPPDGFVFPKIVPAVVSPGVRARFATALDLYRYLREEMPFQAPGSLSDEQYWQITAFLVSANGVEIGNRLLDEQSAAKILLNGQPLAAAPEAALPSQWSVFLRWIGLSSLGLFALALLTAVTLNLWRKG